MIPAQLLRVLNRTLTGVSVAIVTFLLGAPVHAQRVSQDEFAKVATAQAFVRALYPETKDKGYVMNIAASTEFDYDWTSLSDLDVWVGPSDRRSSDTNPPGHAYWKKPEILSALFQFRISDRFINEVNIQFVPLESKFEVLRSQVDAHQRWSDQQVIAAMKKAGAKFGPNDEDALRKEVPIDALEPFIGRLQIESAEFFLRHKQDPRSLAELYWEVDGTSVLPNGQEAHWSLSFEPFAGKLQSLLRGRE